MRYGVKRLALSRWPICCFAAVVALPMLLLAAPSSRPAATRAADDPFTTDIEKEIAGAAAGPRPDAETEARLSAPRRDDTDPRPRTWDDWVRVIHLLGPSLIVGAAVGIACSMTGVFVLLRREALLTLAIPQVVGVGAAIAMRLAWPTLPPALLAVAIAMLLLAAVRRAGLHHWLLPSLYIGGLSASFLVIANHGQDVADLQHLFTGIDVAVTVERAAVATPILLVAGTVVALLWRRWLLLSQAPAAAELAGIKPAVWDGLFLTLLALILLLGTDSLGVVMVLTMLFLPAATILPWAGRIPTAMLGSVLFASILLTAGFVLSNEMQWPMSQSVGGVGLLLVLGSTLTKRIVG